MLDNDDHVYGWVHKVIPPGQKGDVTITHFEMTRSDTLMSMMSHEAGLTMCPEGKYVRMHISKQLVMSDTRMEYVTNNEFAYRANGDVLVAGLGIGFIIVPLLSKTEVSRVFVVERSMDVIDLVYPYIKNEKLHVICADVHEWRPKKGVKFDTIYFDIWHRICGDNLPEMAKLHQSFKYFLNQQNPKKYMDSWSRYWLLNEKRTEKRSRWGW